ncbi:O-antigen/teichoic acid export membrane protein [Agromyces sp. 3263]|uniref:lipopolysaccharide biosynthesis protein n=1 Tax=Agromyces sp. 3263 TaxID=2817750 RepID=UPI0028612C4B|nr:hypothetical protein [Agromyces sp. 3263]MDR6904804.1 O-antigen/teichoic acid export membrane protein [Agromyces sp. 3263]
MQSGAGDEPEARGRRSRGLSLGILTGVGSRALVLLAPILTIPVTLGYLGTELFGFWMVVSSISGLAAFADFGLGNGLLTKLPPLIAAGDGVHARAVTSTAYAVLSCVAGLAFALGWVAAYTVDWGGLFRSSVPEEMLSLTTGLCLSAFAVSLPLSLVQRVQYAYQQAWVSNLWQVAGAITTIAGVYIAVGVGADPLLVIAIGVLVNPAAMLLNSVWYYWAHPDRRPAVARASRSEVGGLVRLGGAFFAISVVTSLALNADALIVALRTDLEAVSTFAVVARLFSVLGLLITFTALPLWPANGDALARGDTQWVRRTTRLMSLIVSIAVGLGGFALVMLSDWIMGIWLGGALVVPPALSIGFVIWSVLLAIASPMFSVQNSVGVLRYQLIAWPIYLALSVPLKLLTVPVLGLPGIPLVSTVCYALLLLPAAALGYRAAIVRASRTPHPEIGVK